MATLEVRIAGMTCQHCIRAVFTALGAVEGVTAAEVQLGRATIDHDGRATIEAVREAVDLAGYQVIDGGEQKRRLNVLG